MLHKATAKPLLEYIQQKHGWDHSTLQSVHWAAHALAIKQTGLPHTHVVKLLHHMLPTHAMLNKFDGGTRKCLHCGSLFEDRRHIMCCDHESRSKWRADFLTALRDFHLQTDTSPFLSSLMLSALRLWFQSNANGDITITPDEYHPTLRHLIRQQNQIGWGQLFLGRFSVEWSLYQQRHLAHQQPSADLGRLSLTWQAKIILLFWDRWYTLWKMRNQDVHGHDARSQAEASKREVRRQLADIYRHRTMYEARVQQLLHRDLEEHKEQHSFGVTKNWLSSNAPIFRESYRRVKQRAMSGMRSLRQYFGAG
jgi:hypothetical protein